MASKKKAAKEPSQRDPNHGKVVRPWFRQRVMVKFRDFVEVPYEDGAEKAIIEKYGGGAWPELQDRFRGLTLTRLFTALPAKRISELVEKAQQRDDGYKPSNLLTWFTVDCPDGLTADELAKRLLQWEIVEKAYPDSPASDPVAPADDTRWANQGYLDPAPEGIDAEFAWTIAGGDGTGQNVIDLEQGWTLNHEDLNAHGASLLFGTLVNASRPHGTSVLGEICAVDNDRGCVGITPELASVNVVSHSGSLSNVADGIIAAVGNLDFGDALLLEVQTVAPLVFGGPVEIRDDVYEAIRLATAIGIVVVEAAGNGNVNLDTFTDASGDQILNPASADFRDSGAIIVGAASSAAPHTKRASSTSGARVNCYAWGQNVDTCTSTSGGSTTFYTGTFSGTSSASPIITGAALAVQGIADATLGFRLSPTQIRNILSDPATGTPSANPAMDRIGVMPNLREIIEDTLDVGVPDLYLRDNPSDIGDPHGGSISASPDIITRPTAVANPQVAYGEGSGTENSSTLGYEVESGQDNFIYTRVRNRGQVPAVNPTVTVYWSEVGTLITPDLWNLVGQVTIPNVPTGDLLTASDAITWLSAEIPATGHYCFVGLVSTPDDPAPALADLMNFDNFRSFVRNNNNATWRNFNVVNNIADAADPAVELPFLIAGAPDRSIRMGLEFIGRLPERATVRLIAPVFLLKALRIDRPFKIEGETAEIVVPPSGVHRLGEMDFHRKFRSRVKLVVELPKDARKTTGYSVAVRQYIVEDQQEVGRVTWYLAAPHFFERRRKQEDCLFELR